MAIVNPNNSHTAVGRLAADPAVFTNKDGSKSVSFAIFADSDYVGRDGKRRSDKITYSAFVPADKNSIYPTLHEGDLVLVSAGLREENWTTKDGERVYAMKVVPTSVRHLESKKVTGDRQARKAAAEGNAAPEAPAAEQDAAAQEQNDQSEDAPF